MKLSFWKILVGVAVFGLCLGAAFGAGTVYGRHSAPQSASAAPITNFTRANSGGNGTTGASGSSGATTGSNNATGLASASQSGTPAAGGLGNRGQGFIGGFADRPIEGKVGSISAQQLQVSLTNGASLTVSLGSSTTYASSQKSDKSILTSGASVYVTTTAASDGTLTAQSIIVLPASQQTASQQPTGGSNGTTGGSTGSGRGGFGGFGGAANRPVDGTVASVNGQTLEIKLANGSTTTVTLGSQTTYAKTSKADQSAVTTGASVLVTASRGSDGTMSAQSIVVLPASGQTS